MEQHDRQFHEAVARFDSENAQDPHTETAEGKPWPKELLYSQRMTRWLERLAPDAPEPLRLAARCQHLRRWEIPRSSYPMDRTGYHRWRTELARMHAERAGQILREGGYDDATIARVQSLIRKERLKQDPQVQLLEDVICLVFLESYFADFAKQHDEQKVIGILRRTWKKMSPRGQAEALKLPLGQSERTLVERALADDSGA